MNITKEQIGNLHLVVSLTVDKNDYEHKVNDVLRDHRRKVNVPGFRPGKVPEGLIRKMFGKNVLVDEINKLVSESLQRYINDEQLRLVGEPMPKFDGDDLDWEIGNDFNFDFEIGLAPDIEVNLSKNDQITKYQIMVDKSIIDKNVEHYAAQFGKFVNVDQVVDFKEKLTGDIIQLNDDNQPLENGLSAEDTSILLSLIRDEKYQEPFKDARVDDEVSFNLSETFPNGWEIASILKKKNKDEVGDINASLFRFVIKDIQKFENAALDQELFQKVFGEEEEITSIEDFENRIRENVAMNFEESSITKFGQDVQTYLMEKYNPPVPEDFLRRWLQTVNKDISQESFDKEFPAFLKSMQWELIATAIAKQYDLKVAEQEIVDFARENTRRQFAMYGMINIPEDTLAGYTMNTLKEGTNVRNIASQLLGKKITEIISDTVDVVVQELPLDDFNKMLYATNNQYQEEKIENSEQE